MKLSITLTGLLKILYPGQAIKNSCIPFLKCIFHEVLPEIDIKGIIGSSAIYTFLKGNYLENKSGGRGYRIADPTNALSETIQAQYARSSNVLLSTLIRNCEKLLQEAQTNPKVKISQRTFHFVNEEAVYSTSIHEMIIAYNDRQNYAAVLAALILVSLFQEYTPQVIFWVPENPTLTPFDGSKQQEQHRHMYHQIRSCAETVLNQTECEQGRMLAFDAVREKMPFPKISSSVYSDFDENAVPLISLFEKPPYQNLLLVGCGGSGKTFAVIDLAKQLQEKQKNIVPFFIPLHRLNADPDTKTPILNYFMDTLAEYYGLEAEDVLEYLHTQKSAVILFLLDGYNELTNHEVKLHFIAEITRLNCEFPNIRFIITGRHDNSATFATGGELPFRTKWIMPLEDHVVSEVISGCSAADFTFELMRLYDRNMADILRNPMMLMMYIHVHSGDFDQMFSKLSLPFDCPQTNGELLGNFAELIRSTHALKGTPTLQSKAEYAIRILHYIAFMMYLHNKSALTEQELKFHYYQAVKNDVDYESTTDFYEKFLSIMRRMGFFICSRASGWQFRFYHPIFRSYFSACYLLDIVRHVISICSTNALAAAERINSVFSEDITDEILQLFGEIASERQFLAGSHRIPGELSVLEQGMQIAKIHTSSHRAVNTLIRAARLARNDDMSTFHFDGIDLTEVPLNGMIFYTMQNGRIHTASFRDSCVSEAALLPNGHMAAVHTFAKVNDHVLSISADAIWSYGPETKVNRRIAQCNGTFVTVSAYVPKHRLLMTGDKNGWIRFLKHPEDISENLQFVECEEHAFTLSDIVRQLWIDEQRDLCLAGARGKHIYQFPISHPEQGTQIILSDRIRNTPKYSFVLIGQYLYLASGMCIYRVHKTSSEITDADLFARIEYEGAGAYIYDFKFMPTVMDGYFILNIRGNEKSAIVAGTGEHWITIRENVHTPGWIGFNRLTVSEYGSAFCISNNIYNAINPAITEVTFNIIRSEFTCQDYYGIQNKEIANSCYISPEEILFSSVDRSMQIVNTATGDITARFQGHNPGLHYLHFLTSDALLACTYDGELLKLQKSRMTGTWHCMQNKHAHSDWANEVAHFCIEAALYAAVCGNDGRITVWNMGTEEQCITIHTSCIVTSVCHLFGRYILAACKNGCILICQLDPENHTYTIESEYHPFPESTHADFLQFHAHLAASDEASAEVLVAATMDENNSAIGYMEIRMEDKLVVQLHKILTKENMRIRVLSSVMDPKTQKRLYTAMGSCHESAQAEHLIVFNRNTLIAEIVNVPEANHRLLRQDTMSENISFLSGTFFTYENQIYIAAASYSHMLQIYQLEGDALNKRAEVYVGFPSIDTKYSDGYVYLTALSGKLLEVPIAEILNPEHPLAELGDQEQYTIYQNISGLHLNYVDFSRSTCEFSDDFKAIIRSYQVKM